MSTPDSSVPVLVLFGGDDAEADVSRASGAEVALAVESAGHPLVAVDLPACDAGAVQRALEAARRALGSFVVFPVMHGPWGEGGTLQQVLEVEGVPFVGSRSDAAARCMDKQRAKDVAEARGVPVIDGGVVTAADGPVAPPVAPPAVVKPVDDGSSMDLFLADDRTTLDAAIARVVSRRGRALVERRVRGREFTIGLLDGDPLPVVEIVSASGTYDYAAKYERADTDYRTAPADLPAALVAEAEDAARTLWAALGVRHLARVDFIEDDGVPRMLEVNTMPGFTARSLFPRAAAAAGLELPALVSQLVQLARVGEPATP